MASSSQKTSRRTVNPIETDSTPDRGLARSELSKAKNTAAEQITGGGQDFISQLLGFEYSEAESIQMSGELLPGQPLNLSKKHQEKKYTSDIKLELPKSEKRLDVLGGYDYRSEIVHGSERLSRREATELDNRIQEIMTELKRLIGSSNFLKAEFASVSVEDKPVQAGKYYLNFFEWLFLEIKKIRMKVEDAGAWLRVMKSKKSLRKYGAMAKKLGTSFTLNNERTPATQTG